MRTLTADFGTPLCPEPDVDQGDPFLLEAPPGAAHRYYVFVSGAGFPVYGSDDLLDWRRVGDSLPADDGATCWAPCVRHLPGSARPWVMLYSRARGLGERESHRYHRILRADSVRPEGPYVDSGEVLTDDLDFAIDPEVYTRRDGSLWLAFATDFVGEPPIGTGLAEAPVDRQLRGLVGPVRPVARASADWQVFDPARSVPWIHVPGVDWAAEDTVQWHCIEAPAALRHPDGTQFMLYSGGNYSGAYAVGVLRQEPGGRWVDLSPRLADCLLAPDPTRGVYAPGHCNVLSTVEGGMYLSFHFRTEPAGRRQFGIAPLGWTGRGLPAVRTGD